MSKYVVVFLRCSPCLLGWRSWRSLCMPHALLPVCLWRHPSYTQCSLACVDHPSPCVSPCPDAWQGIAIERSGLASSQPTQEEGSALNLHACGAWGSRAAGDGTPNFGASTLPIPAAEQPISPLARSHVKMLCRRQPHTCPAEAESLRRTSQLCSPC